MSDACYTFAIESFNWRGTYGSGRSQYNLWLHSGSTFINEWWIKTLELNILTYPYSWDWWICNYSITFLGTKHLEDQIYAEIRGRIKEEDISAPLRRGPYYYYERTLEGKEYVQHCRRLVSNSEAPPSVYDVMLTGPDAPPEHVILDENLKASGHAYYSIGAFKVIIPCVEMFWVCTFHSFSLYVFIIASPSLL